MFKWQAINPCNSIQIEFNQMMGLVLMKPHNFIALLIWITLSLQTLPSFSEHTAERETALCISANGRKGGGHTKFFFSPYSKCWSFSVFCSCCVNLLPEILSSSARSWMRNKLLWVRSDADNQHFWPDFFFFCYYNDQLNTDHMC